MSFKISFLQVVIAFLFLNGFSQEYPNQAYFTALIRELESKPEVVEVIFVQNKSIGGRLKRQCVFVKYYDSVNYWQAGKEFLFYRNGNVKWMINYDKDNHICSDTTIQYYKDGTMKSRLIYDNTLTKTELGYSSQQYFNSQGNFQYCPSNTHDGTHFKRDNIGGRKFQYFFESKLRYVSEYIYIDSLDKTTRLKEIWYNPDGSINHEIQNEEKSF